MCSQAIVYIVILSFKIGTSKKICKRSTCINVFITVSNNDPVRFACVNRVGLSRRGFTPETISQIHDACRILFQSGLNYLNGCEEVEKQIPQSPERDRLIRFIRESQRGIIKPYSQSNEKDE